MEKIRILIVEDDQKQAIELMDSLVNSGYAVTGVARNLQDALGLFYSQQPDLVVTDIYLQGQPDGIKFSKKLNENHNTARPVLFLTQHADVQTFEDAKLTAPYSYLLKPFNPLELKYAIELALEKFQNLTSPFGRGGDSNLSGHELFVKSGPSLVKILTGEIYYVEVDGKYSKIVTDQGSFLLQQSLKKMNDQLSFFSFVRVHRNYLINSIKIKKIHLTDSQVILINDEKIPFSTTYRDHLIGNFDVLK